MQRTFRPVLALLPALLLVAPTNTEAGLVVTIEKPGIQASTVEGVKTEAFDELNTGQYKEYKSEIGTYTGSDDGFAIVNPDAYGGADQTRYMAVGAQSRQLDATLTLTAPQSYFGFLWLAGDKLNTVEFLSGGSVIASFSTAAVFDYVSHSGGPYGNGHFGNPNSNQNQGEPYAYLNFFATSGTVFDKVIFRNSSTGTGFETDNHSVRATPVDVPDSGDKIAELSSVPEPATIASAGLALTVAALSRLRIRSRR